MPPQNQQYPQAPQNPAQPDTPGSQPQPVAPQAQVQQAYYEPAQPAPQGQTASAAPPDMPQQAAQAAAPVDPDAPAQPYQFPAKPHSVEQSPYDFFMEPPKQARKGVGLGDASSKKFLFIVGGAIVFLGLLFGVMSMASKPSGNGPALTRIVQEQQEMIRVSADPAKNSHTDTVQNFAITLQLGLTSAQQNTLAYMAKAGTKIDEKTLSLGANPRTDQALASALSADTYDSTFESIMTSSLNNYMREITAESKVSQSRTERQVLKQDYDGAQLLLKMLPGQTLQ